METLQPASTYYLIIIFALTFVVSSCVQKETPSLGLFEGATDIGDVSNTGSTMYNEDAQVYSLKGSGYNMWFDRDEFHFAWKKMSGDFLLRSHATFVGEGVDPHRKMGVIIRSGLETNAAYVDVAIHGDGLTSMQFRRADGDSTEEVSSGLTAPDIIQLERKDGRYIMSVARFGNNFTSDTLESIDLGDEVYVGLFVSSHNAKVVEEAKFSNFRIVVPAEDDFTPYQDYIGSNLEIMEVETGHRKILHQSEESLQAPNWHPNGETLIYNSNGLLYNFDIESGAISELNTGFATNNNNDHVISFDGTKMGISHHSENHDGQSIIYTLPLEGGTPELVTEQGPSYLHGWSADDEYLTYTAERNGQYDIYKIPATGGEEIQLTNQPTLDDGSEYDPAGDYIYFNSVRTGKMEIWRMKPDGSEQEQLTDDLYNNWFPHISPDGERMVYLAFPADIDPSGHPFYKHVTLNLMPVDGGEPKVIGYLYGGQGTINVPSWSPDSKKIAFISNTQR
jgi:Tol biopolymer transport system component